jgi:drug/metabolite transporter (DMT)-like permease
MTLLYGFGNVLIFESLKRIEASRFTIIFSSRALFTILASSLLLKEGLLAKQFVGTFLILAGIALANVKAARFSFSKKEAMALFAAMIFGFVNTNDRFLLKSFKVYPYVFLAFIVPALFIIALNPYTIKNMKFFVEKKVLLKMLLLCVIYAVSSITFFASLQIAQSSSQVASINLTSVIVIVLLAIIFLKERDFLIPKLLGAASSFVGLLLVS